MKEKNLSSSGRITLFLPVLLIYVFSSWPAYQFHRPTDSQLLVSLKKKTERERECTGEERRAYEEHQSQQLKHMRRKSKDCGTRKRVPLEFRVWVDGVEGVNKIIRPTGIFSDGVAFVFERHAVENGAHDIKVTMRDYRGDSQTRVWDFTQRVEFKPREVVLVTYTPESDSLHIYTH